jgi:hypothetical protein
MCIFLLIISDCGSLHDGEVGALLKKTLLSPKVSSYRVGKRNNKRDTSNAAPFLFLFQKEKKEKIRIENIDNNMVENYV